MLTVLKEMNKVPWGGGCCLRGLERLWESLHLTRGLKDSQSS